MAMYVIYGNFLEKLDAVNISTIVCVVILLNTKNRYTNLKEKC